MHHQCVCTHEIQLHSSVQRPMPPVEIIKHIESGGYACECVENEMGQHDDISIHTNNCARPANVGIDYVFTERR